MATTPTPARSTASSQRTRVPPCLPGVTLEIAGQPTFEPTAATHGAKSAACLRSGEAAQTPSRGLDLTKRTDALGDFLVERYERQATGTCDPHVRCVSSAKASAGGNARDRASRSRSNRNELAGPEVAFEVLLSRGARRVGADERRGHFDIKNGRHHDRVAAGEQGGQTGTGRSMGRFAGPYRGDGHGGIEHARAHLRPSSRSVTAGNVGSPPSSAASSSKRRSASAGLMTTRASERRS
jgi:hypothetical protein